ncbi:hypothetical protein GALL_508480 [mine drainage metagenome]|uniref:Uncharacterized protein n=1 Tax=mine drainage metagenome TaxID=410659 RepID=A0A1J5PJ55_9ZZZZ
MLVPGQQAVDIFHQPLEARRIAPLTIRPMGHGIGTVHPVIGHKAHCLAGDRGRKIAQAFGEQDGTQVGDAPMAACIGLDQPVSGQPFENARPVVWQWLCRQVKIGGVVKLRQHLVTGQELHRNPSLPGIGLQLGPKCPQPFGVVRQLWCRTADANEGGSIELDGCCGRRRYGKQNQSRAPIVDRLELKIDCWLQTLRQP